MAKRIDDNQKLIVNSLRRCGCSVAVTSAIGKGFPDLVVGFRRKNYLFEIKDGNKSPSRRKLTPAEEMFQIRWQGEYYVINNIDEALKIIYGK